MDSARAKLANSKLSNFFEDDDEESSFPPKTVADAKLSQYTSGTSIKSKREKEHEAAEAKKREEEEHAAKVYAEFMETFEGDEHPRRSGGNFVRPSNENTNAYQPSSRGIGSFPLPIARKAPSPPAATAPKPKGKRAMDAFLEEIKRDQADREAKFSRQAQGHGKSITALAAYEGQSGSKDRGDPLTTNVFVANLPSNVTEQSVGNFFARMGPVGSVKIMWPRLDANTGPGADMTASRRSKSSGLSGFVSFMTRKDAEAALRELDGYEWYGSALRVGWGKAVPIAPRAMYTSSMPERSRSREREYDDHSRSPTRDSHGRTRRFSSRSPSPGDRHAVSPPLQDEAETVTDTFIRAVAGEVKGHNTQFEKQLREREKNNPKYAFMLRKNHRRHAFYRGLLESDRVLEPEFDDEGYNSVYSTDSAEESEKERTGKNALGKFARKRFEAMLRALGGKRGEMARCMSFSLDHAEAAHEVVDIIVSSLIVDGTPVPRKVARLHLICDILHNSATSVPGAWKFRQEFQSRLGIVFDHLGGIYHSFPGRITADTFKKQILAVVEIWEDWIVFPPEFTNELRRRLDGSEGEDSEEEKIADEIPSFSQAPAQSTSRFKTGAFKLATAPVEEDEQMDLGSDIDGSPVEDLDGIPLDEDAVDGGDLDGEPIDIDGQPI